MTYSSTRALPFIFGGLIVWSIRFLFIYVFTALACARGFAGVRIGPLGIVPATVLSVTAIALGFNVWLMVKGIGYAQENAAHAEPPNLDSFIGYTAAVVAAMSILAVVWETLPALIIPACAAPA